MTKENLFEAIGGINEDILEQIETATAKKSVWKILVPVAACLSVLIAAAALFLLPSKEKQPEQGSVLPPPANGSWTLNFSTENPIQTQVLGLPVHFKDEMDSAEVEAVLPTNHPEWMTGTGRGEFGEEKELLRVYLKLETTNRHAPIYAYISIKPMYPDLVFETAVSECNGVTFYSFEYKSSYGMTRLETRAKINDYYFLFWTDIKPDSVEQVKADYKQILESFTYYAEPDKPQWSAVTCGKVLESYNETITYQQAREDAAFGAYIPADAPEGLTEVTARRYGGDLSGDTLEVRWHSEDMWLQWTVTRYDPEAHSMRMTSALDAYRNMDDFNLICVAEDLTLGMLRSNFGDIVGIRFGDLLVQFDSRGETHKEWICEQLVTLGIIEPEEVYEDREEEIYGDYDTFISDNGLRDSSLVEHIPRLTDRMVFYHLYSSDRREFLELQYWDDRGEDRNNFTLHITHYDGQPLTDVADKEKYDLSEYVNPWDPYIPAQDRQQMERPIFNAGDLTVDALNARIYYTWRYPTEPRMEFGIRFGDVVVYMFSNNMTPEEVLDIIAQM